MADSKSKASATPLTSPKVSPKPSTGLDPKFELKPGQDPDHIFDEELQMINEVKKQIPNIVTANPDLTDKFYCIFLIARKHKVDRTVQLLNRHFEWRKEWGMATAADIPKLSDVNEDLILCGHTLLVDAIHDKHGRKIQYQFPARMFPHMIDDIKEMMRYLGWYLYVAFERDPLAYWRTGHIIVQDMKGYGMANMSMKFKDHMSKIHESMPMRLSQIYVLNSGTLFNIIMKLARTFIKAKIIQRVKPTTLEEVQDLIDKEHLLDAHGGSLAFNVEEWYELELKKERDAEEKKKGATEKKKSKAKSKDKASKDKTKEATSTKTPKDKSSKDQDKKSKDKAKKAEATPVVNENDGIITDE